MATINLGRVMGPPGQGLKWDASGLFSERHLHDNKPADFVFLAEDQSAIYIRHGAPGNWSIGIYIRGAKGDDARETEFGKSETHIQWRYVGDTTWIDIVPLSELKGADAKNIELQKSATHLQWRLVGDATWTNLVALSELKGDKGDPGPSIEMKTSATHIQWRVVGAADWINLVELADFEGDVGPQGPSIEMKTSATHIQWRVVGDENWIDLVALSEFKGDPGDGDMKSSVYDPQGKVADAFDRGNHTGTQAISTISGLSDELDEKIKSGDGNDEVRNNQGLDARYIQKTDIGTGVGKVVTVQPDGKIDPGVYDSGGGLAGVKAVTDGYAVTTADNGFMLYLPQGTGGFIDVASNFSALPINFMFQASKLNTASSGNTIITTGITNVIYLGGNNAAPRLFVTACKSASDTIIIF